VGSGGWKCRRPGVPARAFLFQETLERALRELAQATRQTDVLCASTVMVWMKR
jgi:hypothetical protein